jgi:methylenetetrahydrofolate dehydrogenase (NADP+) / methenyltetrahydrofolate cyclohydrolase
VKFLNGEELAEYIKERQAREVRALRQAWQVQPKLAVVASAADPASEAYVLYGEDILVDVAICQISQDSIASTVEELHIDSTVHGIIVLGDVAVAAIAPEKDVEALSETAQFDAALPMAVLWLLAGYNVDLQQGKQVVVSGTQTPAGSRLLQMLEASEVRVASVAGTAEADAGAIAAADIVITAADAASTLSPDMLKPEAVVVDAEGAHPLIICALFENVIRAARQTAGIPA